MDSRTAAVTALVQVFAAGRSLNNALTEALAGVAETRDQALAQDLCYGVLRWWPRLEAVAGELLHKPLQTRDVDIHCLVLIGLYQLIYSRVPPHAAVAEAVNGADRLGKSWARGLVNAVLRRFQREGAAVLARIDCDEVNALAHPAWLLASIREDWPGEWRDIAAANNQRPPMCLRINRRRCTRAAYLQELADHDIVAQAVDHAEAAVMLESPMDVWRVPGFREGRVSVQDAAAQFAAQLLDPGPGQRVLDLCAAPGGKTAHILELQPRLAALIAVEIDGARLRRVRENLDRLGLDAELLCADAADPASWWTGDHFDCILLDAPCSATGVIRRHPDIKRLRRPQDIETLVNQQRLLLEAAWLMLAEGGMLLYATCSIMHRENHGQIGDFLSRHADARERPIDATWGRGLRYGRQILPGEARMDGFFYACLHKSRSPELLA